MAARTEAARDAGVRRARLLTFLISLAAAASGFLLFLQFGRADGLDWIDIVRAVLILLSTFWLAWGAAQGLLGLTTRPRPPEIASMPIRGRTVILVPVYNEDPVTTFARIAAMDASLAEQDAGATFDFAILSDTRNEAIAARGTAVVLAACRRAAWRRAYLLPPPQREHRSQGRQYRGFHPDIRRGL